MLANAGIVRHRGKIESTINNAQRVLELRREFGSLAAYAWRHEPAAKTRPRHVTWAALKAMTTSAESMALSKDLKKRGWTFVGPTTVYAFMQVMGLVNDHVKGCSVRESETESFSVSDADIFAASALDDCASARPDWTSDVRDWCPGAA